MPACVVSSCKNHHYKGFVLLRFPRDEQLKKQWQDAIGPYGPPEWQPTKDYRICEVHFKPDDWRKYRWYLNEGAVPSLFEGSPLEKISGVRTPLQKKERKRKQPSQKAPATNQVAPTFSKVTILELKNSCVIQPSASVSLKKNEPPQVKTVQVLFTETRPESSKISETAKLASSVREVPVTHASANTNSHSVKNVCPPAKSVEELFIENGLDWFETGNHFLSSLM